MASAKKNWGQVQSFPRIHRFLTFKMDENFPDSTIFIKGIVQK